jgi:hypothetical protein
VGQHPLQPGPAFVTRQPGQLLQVDLIQQDLLEPARTLGVVSFALGPVTICSRTNPLLNSRLMAWFTVRVTCRSRRKSMGGASTVTRTPWSRPEGRDVHPGLIAPGRLAWAAATADWSSEYARARRPARPVMRHARYS